MKNAKRKSRVPVGMTVFPLLMSVMMTVCFSPVILAVSFAVTLLVTLLHPAYRNRRGVWMFLFVFVFSVPLNVRLLSEIDEWLVYDNVLFKCLSVFVAYSILVSLEEIAAGIIFKTVMQMLYRKPKTVTVSSSRENEKSTA